VRFIAVLGNTVGAGSNYLELIISRFLFPIRYLVTKSELRCFVALAGILPAIRYVPTCWSNTSYQTLPVNKNSKNLNLLEQSSSQKVSC